MKTSDVDVEIVVTQLLDKASGKPESQAETRKRSQLILYRTEKILPGLVSGAEDKGKVRMPVSENS
jgi:hypothetical protein